MDLSTLAACLISLAAIIACATIEAPRQSTYRRAMRRNRKG